MIYFVTNQTALFDSPLYERINVERSLEIMKDWKQYQYDSETSSLDCHIGEILCIQFGNREADIQMVVDATTVDISVYKNFIESHLCIGHNLKFDLQWLYNYGIIPRKTYDTMIVEQLIYLGYGHNQTYNLKDVAHRRLGVSLDKEIRGQIIWRGLDDDVIHYAANDVRWLEDIMDSQKNDLREKHLFKGAKLECDVVPAMAYLEWCGIKLDIERWKEKMKNDKANLQKALTELNSYVMSKDCCKRWVQIDNQGDLFTGFDLTPHWTIDWQKKEAIKVFQALGFDTKAISKTTGEETDSVLEKNLKVQKGVDDQFLDLYFKYQEYYKVTTSFGQGHLNAVNPKTGRIHSTFKQLGAQSGRMSCGSNQPNEALAKLKGIPPSECTYPNLQQLPSDEFTRSCFIAPEKSMMVSADFSAEESRLAADIYQDKEFLKEFTEGSGDTHSMFAWIVFNKECKELGCTGPKDVKKLAPKQRKAVKGYEFGWMFGAAAPTLAQTVGCTIEEAQSVIDKLEEGFKGVSEYAKRGATFVRNNGYILINPETGHRLNWWDWNEWKKEGESFTQEFWEDYRMFHKGTGDEIAKMVKKHFQVASKYDRLARNCVTQGTGAIIMKHAITELFNWIITNNYFNKVHICACIHDEIVCDYPTELSEFPKILEKIMEDSAARYCHSLPIPAEASVEKFWVH